MKKKILFLSEALWIGGIETALVNLLNRMDYEKYDVTCMVTRGCLELAGRITPQCRLIVADRERAYTFPLPYRYSRLYHLTEKAENPSRLHKAMQWVVPAIQWVENRLYIRYIRRQMAGERFDTCVIYSDRTAEIGVRAIRAGQYLMFYHHGSMRREYHDEIGYRRSRRIISVSERTMEALKAYRPRYAHKMTAIHNIVDIEGVLAKSRVAIPEVFSPDSFHIVSCGRVSREKGMDLAVEAAARLVEMGHRNIHWWIVGGGPAEEEVRDRIAQTHMEPWVTLLGMRENPYPYIAKADLYVQPSRYENYSVVILEAMALRKPILATTPAAETQITSGENGLLCDANPESIASCIEYLYHHPEEREKYTRALARGGLDKQNEDIMNSLYRLLDRK